MMNKQIDEELCYETESPVRSKKPYRVNYFVIVEFELMFLRYPLKHIMEGL